ncbi:MULTISPECIES: hypothetical protein [unclassified Mesorhizobium]|uniref:hypothetical protein n=1 Tax=unclassified Mesorhizobium TaxID=325217 RepID=UPI001FE0C2BA|nr:MULTISPECIES: hypothetical protein [unclassified Mesorhizobium]
MSHVAARLPVVKPSASMACGVGARRRLWTVTYFRISTAISEEVMTEAPARIKAAVAQVE